MDQWKNSENDKRWKLTKQWKVMNNTNDLAKATTCEEAAEGAHREKITNFDI